MRAKRPEVQPNACSPGRALALAHGVSGAFGHASRRSAVPERDCSLREDGAAEAAAATAPGVDERPGLVEAATAGPAAQSIRMRTAAAWSTFAPPTAG